MIAQRAFAERVRGRRQQRPAVRLTVDTSPQDVDHLSDLAYSPTLNRWAAVGSLAYIVTSPGGAGAWTQRVSDYSPDLYSIIWTGLQFVAVGQRDQIFVTSFVTSPDGITWGTTILDAFVEGVDLVGVAHDGAGRLLAVGCISGAGAPRACKSDDHGDSWVQVGVPGTKSFRSVTYDGTLWIAAGGFAGQGTVIATSADRVNFTPRAAPASNGIRYIASGGGLVVAIGEKEGGGAFVITSSDHGVTWAGPHPHPAPNQGMSAFWTGRQWVMLAWLGGASGDPSAIYTSRDARVWAELRRHTRQLTGIKQNQGGELVAVGGKTFATGSAIVRTHARL